MGAKGTSSGEQERGNSHSFSKAAVTTEVTTEPDEDVRKSD